MLIGRSLAAALVVAAGLGVPAAQAAPAPVFCHLVKDPTGDANGFAAGQQSPRNDDPLDFKELDLLSGGASLTALIRTYSLNGADVMAPTGRRYTYTFTVRRKAYPIVVYVDWNGQVTSQPSGVAHLDSTPSVYELKVTVPLSAFGLKLTSRDRFARLDATAERWYGGPSGQKLGDTVDTAGGAIGYPHGGRSCVTPVT